jgi:glycosyltransferase involved in cell wall biosynthesis
MKKVSVIVPAYNEEKFLLATLESIRKQIYRNFEIIVKDGLSKDKTLAIAERYANRVISKKDVSAGDARNQGATYADGDILIFVDADTLLAPDTVERIVRDFEKPSVTLVFPNYLPKKEILEIDGRKAQMPRRIDTFWFSVENLVRRYIDKYAGGMCMACDAKTFREIGGFNKELKVCEDIEISYRLRKKGYAICDRNIVAYPSARRYVKIGFIKTLFTYFFYSIQWHLGMEQSQPKIIR